MNRFTAQAPDIAGQGLANPIGQIWTAKLMLDHFGEEEPGGKILDVMEQVTADGIKTRDIGGQSTTAEVTDEICSRLRKALMNQAGGRWLPRPVHFLTKISTKV